MRVGQLWFVLVVCLLAASGCVTSGHRAATRYVDLGDRAMATTVVPVAAVDVSRESEPLVPVLSVDPSIFIELRYAGSRNAVGRAIYSSDSICMVRRSVAERLKVANQWLRSHGYALKIWDGYRSLSAQREIYEAARKQAFVGNPNKPLHCLHTWGVAVDATLVTINGDPVAMPTDFDDFSAAARSDYTGHDPEIRRHLKLLQGAMGRGGFVAYKHEWWHFVAKDWEWFAPVEEGES